jgi:hypothetical protein
MNGMERKSTDSPPKKPIASQPAFGAVRGLFQLLFLLKVAKGALFS